MLQKKGRAWSSRSHLAPLVALQRSADTNGLPQPVVGRLTDGPHRRLVLRGDQNHQTGSLLKEFAEGVCWRSLLKEFVSNVQLSWSWISVIEKRILKSNSGWEKKDCCNMWDCLRSFQWCTKVVRICMNWLAQDTAVSTSTSNNYMLSFPKRLSHVVTHCFP